MKTIRIIILVKILLTYGVAQTPFSVESLKTFAKVYGYVKYFHPSDEAANLDWDKFAIYGAGQVEKCLNKEELFKTLNELFLPIAPTIKFYNTNDSVKFNIASITPDKPQKYKPTYWQHLGVGNGMLYQSNTYKSIRVNRKGVVDKSSPYDAGNLMTWVYAGSYGGKRIKFTGWVKLMEGSKGTGHLWLREDKVGDKMGFFDNMDDRPITSHAWEKYEITGNLDIMSNYIVLGCFLKGSGKLLVDDMHLYYMENGGWIEIPIKNSGFETEDIGRGKTWEPRSLKDYKIKIVDEGSFEGKNCVMLSKSNDGKTVKGKKLFESEPEIGEFINKNIGSGISCIIPLTLYATEKYTFPMGSAESLNHLMEGTKTSEFGLNLRTGDVIITWNIFQHFYPYFDVVKVDWESELETALLKSYRDSDKRDFQITLQKLTAPLKDDHVDVHCKPYTLSYQPRIAWEFIENKLVITKVCSWHKIFKVGDIVTEVNGMTPEKYFESIGSRISAATPGWMAYRANTMTLMGDKDSVMDIVVNNEHSKILFNMQLEYTGLACRDNFPSKNITFKFIDSGIIYLNLDVIPMKTIDSLLPHLTKAKSIICDLRGYPNSNHEFIQYLMTKEDHDKWMFVPQFIYPDREKLAGYKSHGWEMKPRKPHLNAKIIFITDGRAVSYAESYMGFIEGYKLAIIIGQPTAGTNGNVNPFMLPGGYYISWTGMKVLKHDGSQQHGVGIIPNVYVSKTIKGVIEGRDEFLEKAIELARQR